MQIVSGSRDKTIKLWNTLGECKYTIGEPEGHTEWVSCVRFSPVTTNPIIVSAGWDKLVKVRCLSCAPVHPTQTGAHLVSPGLCLVRWSPSAHEPCVWQLCSCCSAS